MSNTYLDAQKLMLPEAVLFDTDNTLYYYDPADDCGIKAVRKKVNRLFGISSLDFDEAFKTARAEIKAQLGSTASSHSRLLYFQRLLEILGFKAQLLTALDLEQTYWRTFLANAPLFDGVIELIERLTSLQIRVAIVTDLTANIQMRKLSYFGLENAFDAVVTSEEVGLDKPDSRIFKLALKKLNLHYGGPIWMIGDNPIADIMGGKSIGAITFQKIHHNVQRGRGDLAPDFSFRNFNEIISIIESISCSNE